MTVIAYFRVEGLAADLAVAPPDGESVIFERGAVEVTLEGRVDESLGLVFDCLVSAQTSREISDDAYRMLRERIDQPRRVGRLQAVERHPPEALDRLCRDIYAEL